MNEPEWQDMAQTFDIRFDAAGNSFGWKGGGRLSVDSQGMSFALKRGLASLLARRKSQRIPAENIREVYREGEALRVEFATDENPRVTLPFRARDRDSAAQIVRLLPTSRTIELEQTTPVRVGREIGAWPLVLGAAVLLAGAALVATFWRAPAVDGSSSAAPARRDAPVAAPAPAISAKSRPSSSGDAAVVSAGSGTERITPDEARKLAILAEDPVDWTRPPPASRGTAAAERRARFERMAASLPAAEPALPAADPEVEGFVPMEVPDLDVRPDHVVIRIGQTTLAYDSARGMLSAFEAQADEFTAAYRRERERFDDRTLDARAFANRLEALEMRWQALGEGLLGARKYSDPALGGMRGSLQLVVIQQRAFLAGYAEGLRSNDQPRIERAFADLARAEEFMARAREYVN